MKIIFLSVLLIVSSVVNAAKELKDKASKKGDGGVKSSADAAGKQTKTDGYRIYGADNKILAEIYLSGGGSGSGSGSVPASVGGSSQTPPSSVNADGSGSVAKSSGSDNKSPGDEVKKGGDSAAEKPKTDQKEFKPEKIGDTTATQQKGDQPGKSATTADQSGSPTKTTSSIASEPKLKPPKEPAGFAKYISTASTLSLTCFKLQADKLSVPSGGDSSVKARWYKQLNINCPTDNVNILVKGTDHMICSTDISALSKYTAFVDGATSLVEQLVGAPKVTWACFQLDSTKLPSSPDGLSLKKRWRVQLAKDGLMLNADVEDKKLAYGYERKFVLLCMNPIIEPVKSDAPSKAKSEPGSKPPAKAETETKELSKSKSDPSL